MLIMVDESSPNERLLCGFFHPLAKNLLMSEMGHFCPSGYKIACYKAGCQKVESIFFYEYPKNHWSLGMRT
jgi:hypothetical protein